MISKLRFSLIAVIMLVLLGFGFQDQAKGQIGLDGLFCPNVPQTTGWLETQIVGPGLVAPDFTAGLLGTIESIPNGVDVVGGLDWQHVDYIYGITNNPTNETGSQLVSWWTLKDGRNTYLQVTNAELGAGDLHVVIFDENCVEIRNFCDFYTPLDTHQYDFGNLVANDGQLVTIPPGNEGFVVVTAVENCDTSSEVAQDYDFLSGQTVIVDPTADYAYGINTYARQSVCFNTTDIFTVNRIFDGSFQFDGDGWSTQLVRTFIIQGNEISPEAPTPPNPYDSPNMGFVVSSDDNNGGSNATYDGGSFPNLADANLIDVAGLERDVAILQSDLINVPVGLSTDATLSYNLQFYTGEDFIATCANYAAVLLIQDNGAGNGTIIDATCYQQDGTVAQGNIDSQVQANKPCVLLADTDSDIAFGPFEFDGRTGFQIGETLSRNGQSGNFRVQVVTGLSNAADAACVFQDSFTDQDTAALVNNFELLGDEEIEFVCDGDLTGAFNARFDYILPDTLAGQFNVLPGNVSAGSDAVIINFADSFDPYRPIAATSVIDISIFDEHEQPLSCGLTEVCFVRLGVDDNVENSDTFIPPTLIPTTAPPTTAPPTTAPPTTAPPTPTPTNNNGGSSSCAIAGSPVQLGTALANVLIPLVPVAFAFGVRAVRRRKK